MAAPTFISTLAETLAKRVSPIPCASPTQKSVGGQRGRAYLEKDALGGELEVRRCFIHDTQRLATVQHSVVILYERMQGGQTRYWARDTIPSLTQRSHVNHAKDAARKQP